MFGFVILIRYLIQKFIDDLETSENTKSWPNLDIKNFEVKISKVSNFTNKAVNDPNFLESLKAINYQLIEFIETVEDIKSKENINNFLKNSVKIMDNILNTLILYKEVVNCYNISAENLILINNHFDSYRNNTNILHFIANLGSFLIDPRTKSDNCQMNESSSSENNPQYKFAKTLHKFFELIKEMIVEKKNLLQDSPELIYFNQPDYLHLNRKIGFVVDLLKDDNIKIMFPKEFGDSEKILELYQQLQNIQFLDMRRKMFKIIMSLINDKYFQLSIYIQNCGDRHLAIQEYMEYVHENVLDIEKILEENKIEDIKETLTSVLANTKNVSKSQLSSEKTQNCNSLNNELGVTMEKTTNSINENILRFLKNNVNGLAKNKNLSDSIQNFESIIKVSKDKLNQVKDVELERILQETLSSITIASSITFDEPKKQDVKQDLKKQNDLYLMIRKGLNFLVECYRNISEAKISNPNLKDKNHFNLIYFIFERTVSLKRADQSSKYAIKESLDQLINNTDCNDNNSKNTKISKLLFVNFDAYNCLLPEEFNKNITTDHINDFINHLSSVVRGNGKKYFTEENIGSLQIKAFENVLKSEKSRLEKEDLTNIEMFNTSISIINIVQDIGNKAKIINKNFYERLICNATYKNDSLLDIHKASLQSFTIMLDSLKISHTIIDTNSPETVDYLKKNLTDLHDKIRNITSKLTAHCDTDKITSDDNNLSVKFGEKLEQITKYVEEKLKNYLSKEIWQCSDIQGFKKSLKYLMEVEGKMIPIVENIKKEDTITISSPDYNESENISNEIKQEDNYGNPEATVETTTRREPEKVTQFTIEKPSLEIVTGLNKPSKPERPTTLSKAPEEITKSPSPDRPGKEEPITIKKPLPEVVTKLNKPNKPERPITLSKAPEEITKSPSPDRPEKEEPITIKKPLPEVVTKLNKPNKPERPITLSKAPEEITKSPSPDRPEKEEPITIKKPLPEVVTKPNQPSKPELPTTLSKAPEKITKSPLRDRPRKEKPITMIEPLPEVVPELNQPSKPELPTSLFEAPEEKTKTFSRDKPNKHERKTSFFKEKKIMKIFSPDRPGKDKPITMKEPLPEVVPELNQQPSKLELPTTVINAPVKITKSSSPRRPEKETLISIQKPLPEVVTELNKPSKPERPITLSKVPGEIKKSPSPDSSIPLPLWTVDRLPDTQIIEEANLTEMEKGPMKDNQASSSCNYLKIYYGKCTSSDEEKEEEDDDSSEEEDDSDSDSDDDEYDYESSEDSISNWDISYYSVYYS
ncbi:titin-like [Leptopilina heterotoma]|uniref:titin-like n=1 Tax=Leptopilina heterotoma TaxID=63436 RepID=UPI001CA9F917|nr:titin-like [Leptopilina heterotoma]